MLVQCNECGVKLDIPDERLPLGKRVLIQCPKCQNKFPVVREGAAAPERPEIKPRDLTEVELADYEEGKSYAMLLVESQDLASVLYSSLKELGLMVHVEGSPELAVQRLKVYKFQLMVVEDGYKGFPLTQNPVMEYLNQLNMMVRRQMFVVAVGEFRTLDPMLAYSLSVELAIHRRDMARFKEAFLEVRRWKQTFYKAFLETMEELGKA
jgi:hypothetical protein